MSNFLINQTIQKCDNLCERDAMPLSKLIWHSLVCLLHQHPTSNPANIMALLRSVGYAIYHVPFINTCNIPS